MEGVTVGAGDLAFLVGEVILHAVRTGSRHIPRKAITTHVCSTMK